MPPPCPLHLHAQATPVPSPCPLHLHPGAVAVTPSPRHCHPRAPSPAVPKPILSPCPRLSPATPLPTRSAAVPLPPPPCPVPSRHRRAHATSPCHPRAPSLPCSRATPLLHPCLANKGPMLSPVSHRQPGGQEDVGLGTAGGDGGHSKVALTPWGLAAPMGAEVTGRQRGCGGTLSRSPHPGVPTPCYPRVPCFPLALSVPRSPKRPYSALRTWTPPLLTPAAVSWPLF